MNCTLPERLDLNPLGSQSYMSPETVAACALAEVWKQGRKFQRDHDTAALVEFARMGVRP